MERESEEERRENWCVRGMWARERETKGLRQRQRYREGRRELSNGTVVTWDSGRMAERGRESSQPVERGEDGVYGVDRLIAGEEDRGNTVIERGSGQTGQW